MNRYRIASLSLIATAIAATGVIWTADRNSADAHCQVPCGIYDDAGRIKQIKEDATTIAKAVTKINELAGSHDAQGMNQAIRWVVTKEAHASNVIETVSLYFLTQKVKPVAPGGDGHDAYLKSLADHHAVMSAAMKTKQSVDPAAVATLNKAIDRLAAHY